MALLRQDGPRVHRVPVGQVPLRVSVSGSRRGSRDGRRPQGRTELAVPAPHTSGVEMLHGPSVLKQTIPQSPHAVNPPGWRISEAAAHSLCAGAELPPTAPASQNHPCDQGMPYGDTWFVSMPPVLDGLRMISRFPQKRKGLMPCQIGERESESHLNEARAAKGIVPENARLLAVFRRTPVELISHVRFDESRMLLLFRLVPYEGRRSTRIHDVAAVKDLATGKVHLIPHRTLCRTVLL
jgi:hypothetical protein